MSSNPATHGPIESNIPEPNSTEIKCSLSSMPYEIKEIIVRWLYLSSEVNHQRRRHSQYDIPHDFIGFSSLESDDGSTSSFSWTRDDSLIDLESLASVNQTFYEICRPYLYERFEFYGGPLERIKFTLEEIIQRHSDCVRNIWWRGLYSDSFDFTDYDLDDDEDWDPRQGRSDLLLEILKACPHLTHLDVDLDTDQQMAPLFASYAWSHHESLTNRFIEPISQMVSLTHLSLSPAYDRSRFTEQFLVSILSNLSQLQSFTCCGVETSMSKRSTRQPSPLGVHLASLHHLTQLVLDEAECFDGTWTQLSWRSSLTELSLKDCDISLTVLHRFTRLFASTLTKLSLENVPNFNHRDWLDIPSPDCCRKKFELPELTTLEISSSLPIPLLRAFKASRNISLIGLYKNPNVQQEDLEEIIMERLWPDLQKLKVARGTAHLTPDGIESLKMLCCRYGVKIHFDNRSLRDDDESEFDFLEIAMSMLNAARNDSPTDGVMDDDVD